MTAPRVVRCASLAAAATSGHAHHQWEAQLAEQTQGSEHTRRRELAVICRVREQGRNGNNDGCHTHERHVCSGEDGGGSQHAKLFVAHFLDLLLDGFLPIVHLDGAVSGSSHTRGERATCLALH